MQLKSRLMILKYYFGVIIQKREGSNTKISAQPPPAFFREENFVFVFIFQVSF